MSPEYLLGVDLGTSSVKAVLTNRQGDIAAYASKDYDIKSPQHGWAEQDPNEWYRSTSTVIRQVLSTSGLKGDDIAAIGLSGQMHGVVCLDGNGRLLRSAVIWADQRSREQVERLTLSIGKEKLGDWTGGPLAAGFMLPTWIWLREHEPDLCRQTRHLLLPKDYLRWRLTRQIGTEPSDASSTGMFDTANRHWSAPMIDFVKIDPALLPPVYESAAPAGEITRKVSTDTGLRTGIPVVFGGSDQACQALGHGVYDPGSISCTIGTGGQLFSALDRPVFDPKLRLHLFCHVLPDRWHQLAAILSAGLSLKWLRSLISPDESFHELANSAAGVSPGSDGLFFLPYLSGERTPHMDPSARGAFVGLTLRHTRAHLVRAVMEGVVFALRQGLDLMMETGVREERIYASGGAVAHPLWRDLLADIFGREIFFSGIQEASAVGAALLAGVGSGFYPDVRSASADRLSSLPEITYPDSKRSVVYEEAYLIYTSLYPALKERGLL